MANGDWFLYALRCADDTLYTGVTTDLARRLREHNSGRGARYTSGRGPVELIAAWRFPDRSAAQRAEARFRRLPRARKLALAAQERPFDGADFHFDEYISPLRFCTNCGGLLKATTPPGGRSHYRCTVCGRNQYRNAKPCAGALIMREGRLLLVQRAISPYRGYWDIPGGFLELDELPADGAVREAQEETGLEVRLIDLFGFYIDRYGEDGRGVYCLNIYFLAEVVGGEECLTAESADLAWFAPDELPDQIAFEHARHVLDRWAQSVKAGENKEGV